MRGAQAKENGPVSCVKQARPLVLSCFSEPDRDGSRHWGGEDAVFTCTCTPGRCCFFPVSIISVQWLLVVVRGDPAALQPL